MFVFGGIGAWWGSTHGIEGTIDRTAWMYASAMVAQIPFVLVYAYLRKKCGSKHIAEISIVTFVVFVPIALATTGLLHSLFSYGGIEPSTPIGHETLAELTEAPWTTATWVVIICVTVGAGIFEEVLYRGLLLPTFTALLGGKTAWGAIMVTSVIFASMHIGVSPPSALFGLFVLSIGLCWARVKSGGVLSPIIIHVVFNAMNIAFVYSTTL
jgi:membrane protease YdiL (CAAX protease family)